MAKSNEQLIRIVSSGGGIIIDGLGKTTEQLLDLASASSKSGAKIIITNVNSKNTDQLAKISSQSKGNIIFDFRE